jgi:chromosome segregation ATPase
MSLLLIVAAPLGQLLTPPLGYQAAGGGALVVLTAAITAFANNWWQARSQRRKDEADADKAQGERDAARQAAEQWSINKFQDLAEKWLADKGKELEAVRGELKDVREKLTAALLDRDRLERETQALRGEVDRLTRELHRYTDPTPRGQA